MLNFLARRLLSTLPVLLIVSLLVFGMLRLTPGDPAAVLAGDAATSEQIAQIRAGLGLDRSIPEQFGIWFGHMLTGDLGQSFYYKTAVTTLIGQRVAQQHGFLGQAFGARGADVVLAQRFQHRGAGDTGDQRDVDDAQRDRRQREVIQPRPDPVGDALVALHRQPAQLDRDTPDEQIGQHEDRDRKTQHRKPISARSIQPPKRQAASTPSGTATSTAIVMVSSASDSVGSRRWPINVLTSVL